MPLRIHALRRADLRENGVLTFEVAGRHYLVADIEGDVHAFAVVGPAAMSLEGTVIAEGRLRCPVHGWSIDLDEGRCGAAELCRYDRVPVEVEEEEIRVSLPSP
jgi:nitrite reductase/ring-hydroxylating ferredoxin subunit